jgi:hypothetical protein
MCGARDARRGRIGFVWWRLEFDGLTITVFAQTIAPNVSTFIIVTGATVHVRVASGPHIWGARRRSSSSIPTICRSTIRTTRLTAARERVTS